MARMFVLIAVIGLGSALGCSSSPTKPKDGGSGGSTGTGGVTGSGGSGGAAGGSGGATGGSGGATGGSGGATGGSGGGNADAGAGGTDSGGPDGPGGDRPAGTDAAVDAPAGDGGRGPMTFFVTGMINAAFGGALGGLAGADMRCQRSASDVGAGGRTWRAYLSTSASGGQPAVNARDRIGTGPWHNAAGVQIAANVAALHTPAMNLINAANGLDHWGNPSTDVGDHVDILTGSTADGMALPESENATCMNWTHGGLDSKARVGHRDRQGDGSDGASFNSAHTSTNCGALPSPQGVGSGRLYCFAIN